jgi:hypothetical protein
MDAVLEHELAGIKELLTSAELTEAKARVLREPETVGICNHPYGLAACEDAIPRRRSACRTCVKMTPPFVRAGLAKLREIEGRLRDCLRKDETVEGMAMLRGCC